MIDGVLGRKLGMVQVFDPEGRMRGATVIEAGPCLVTQIKTTDRDGYDAVQLGFGSAKRRNKPMRGHLKQQGDLRYLREFKVDEPSKHAIGERIGVEMFEPGDRVNVTGTSKGRGFAGVVKRYHFAGGPKTHGQSDRHRARGSIGAGNTPGRVFKGMRMAGHMGAEQVTVRRLEVLQSDPARGLLIVAGSVPGPKDGLLKIRYDAKTLEVARTREPKQFEETAPPADEEETPTAEAETTAEDEETTAAEKNADSDESAEDAPQASADEEETSDDADSDEADSDESGEEKS
ncbi:MAG: 50S ribosomal protein L3 [Chloroflexi bacterium]|nr:50S ribosomal protein L3 [Chloroflexota bacterium]MCI0855393.1 50S ribosomal protein L3 [Chloroflexota bacterium]